MCSIRGTHFRWANIGTRVLQPLKSICNQALSFCQILTPRPHYSVVLVFLAHVEGEFF